ncbi:MAG TPA: family 16 glycosylhydrolase, partial [Prolixibacteraceae bacterium]|nr:family 16 glycosylhydrolase [Prolixibacteraceae bacterium]
MIKYYFLLFIFLYFSHGAFAQLFPYNSNEWDPDWTYTVFSDSFDSTSLNTKKWDVVTDFGRGNCVFVDSTGLTYLVDSSFLHLNMAYSPGYCYDLNGTSHCPDYIAAEIVSKKLFKYGIYEGRMKFAVEKGSWPAFWFFGGSGASNPMYNKDGYASEIDIAEHNWFKNFIFRSHHTEHVLHWWWPSKVYGSDQASLGKEGSARVSADRGEWHTFKLIYTPYYLRFFVDGNLSWEKSRFYILNEKGEKINIVAGNLNENPELYEHEWFPRHEGNIRLSQQVAGTVNNPVAPQTSLFDWVTFKSFFEAPTITCPDFIYSGNDCTPTLNVNPKAQNVTWSLSPASLFTGKLTGKGKTAE